MPGITKQLHRQLGLASVVSIALGAMMGSGIFVLPGLAAIVAGPWVALSYLLAGVLVLPAVLSKAELATAMPVAGGTYVYIERSMGPWMGTIAGLATWFALAAKTSFAVVGLGTYLVIFAPGVSTLSVALGVLLFLLGINVLGAGKATAVQIAIVTTTVAAMLVLCSGSLVTADPSLLWPAFPHGQGGIVRGAALVFVAYAGVTKVCSIAEEVRDPTRNLPLGMLIAQFAVMALYAAVGMALTTNVSVQQLHDTHDLTPVATLGGAVFGPVGRIAFAAVAVAGLISMVNAGILSSSRFPFAMARDRLVPSALEHVSPRFGTPTASIALTGAFLVLLVTVLPVYELAKLASGMQIFVFAVVNACIIVLRESGATWYRPTFRTPGYPFVQIVGILGGVWLLASLGGLVLGGIAAAILFGSAWYLVYVRARVERGGLLGHLVGEAHVLRATERLEREQAGLHDEVRVVVPVFGDEPAPERLVWLASAFIDHGRLDVLRLEEIPDQTALGAYLTANAATRRLAEETLVYAAERRLEVEFRDVLTHNAKEWLYTHAVNTGAEWIVREWPHRGTLRYLIRHQLAWWVDHPPCDLALFLDRHGPFDGDPRDDLPRVLVDAVAGPYDSLLIHVAERVAASQRNGRITLFAAVTTEAERAEKAEYHAQLASLCSLEVSSRVVVAPDPAAALVQASADADLLIIGAPAETTLRTLFFGSDVHRLVAAVPCSVLQIKAPRHKVHDRVVIHDDSTEALLSLTDHLERAVVARVDAARQADLFTGIADRLAEATTLTSAELDAALWQRERAQTTALPEGLAVITTSGAVDAPVVGLFTTPSPVPFSKGLAVDVVVVVLAAPGHRQLQLVLADRLARALRHLALPELRRATDEAALRRILLDTWELEALQQAD
ncbi:MAG: APA family basic amino acid/polyamine antiporter [Myxococcota bacterium]|jgi:APA family basic amino acid/polyamine antiporter